MNFSQLTRYRVDIIIELDNLGLLTGELEIDYTNQANEICDFSDSFNDRMKLVPTKLQRLNRGQQLFLKSIKTGYCLLGIGRYWTGFFLNSLGDFRLHGSKTLKGIRGLKQAF